MTSSLFLILFSGFLVSILSFSSCFSDISELSRCPRFSWLVWFVGVLEWVRIFSGGVGSELEGLVGGLAEGRWGLRKFVISCFLFTNETTCFFLLVLAIFWSGLGGSSFTNLVGGLVTLLMFSSTLACCWVSWSSWGGGVVVKTGLLKGGKEMQWGNFTVVSGDLLVILVMLLMLLLGITLF